MKKYICVLILMLIVPFVIVAKDTTGQTKLNHKIKGPSRPSKPSNTYIDVYVFDDSIIFDLPENIDYMTVELRTGETVVMTGTVDHEDASLDVSGLQGEYEILCRTDGNQLFGGIINL